MYNYMLIIDALLRCGGNTDHKHFKLIFKTPSVHIALHMFDGNASLLLIPFGYHGYKSLG